MIICLNLLCILHPLPIEMALNFQSMIFRFLFAQVLLFTSVVIVFVKVLFRYMFLFGFFRFHGIFLSLLYTDIIICIVCIIKCHIGVALNVLRLFVLEDYGFIDGLNDGAHLGHNLGFDELLKRCLGIPVISDWCTHTPLELFYSHVWKW